MALTREERPLRAASHRYLPGRLFAAACMLFTAAPAIADAAAPPPLERAGFVYEGRRLAYFCLGQGTPTLILEAPSGVSSEAAFARVLPALGSRARVCAYERAFYGESEPLAPGEVQAVQDYAAELAAFLALDSIEAPFVLVGFSYGGFVARHFTGHHPRDVVGMVLIDSPHVDWLRTMQAEMTAEDWQKVEEIMDWFLENRGHDVWQSQFQVEAAPPLPAQLPVAVITRGQDHERMRLSGISEAGFRIYNDVHFRLAPALLELTERTVAFVAAESDHMIPDAEPAVVLAAVDEILSMVGAGLRDGASDPREGAATE